MNGRDTIPRLHRIAEHAKDQLLGIAEGKDTFEAARVRYGETQERLARAGIGRLTASRMAEDEKNWAPTRDVLSELIRLGALAPQRVPSARKHLDAHRANLYELTDYGSALADAAQADRSDFVDKLTVGLLGAHPYLRRLLLALRDGPVVCPAVSEGDVERGRRDQLGSAGWGRWAVEQIGGGIEPEEAGLIITQHLGRRFGANPPERPSNKAISEAMNDALAVAGFRAKGLSLDATTINTLLRWGTDLLLFDQSRYVPALPESNTIWIACGVELNEGTLQTTRRGLAANGEVVAAALVKAYREQAPGASTMLASPYLPIHRVRAQAAFETNTMRKLADLVLAHMLDGAIDDIGMSVAVHIGTSQLPNSEPPFLHNGRRRLEMTISNSTQRSDK